MGWLECTWGRPNWVAAWCGAHDPEVVQNSHIFVTQELIKYAHRDATYSPKGLTPPRLVVVANLKDPNMRQLLDATPDDSQYVAVQGERMAVVQERLGDPCAFSKCGFGKYAQCWRKLWRGGWYRQCVGGSTGCAGVGRRWPLGAPLAQDVVYSLARHPP